MDFKQSFITNLKEYRKQNNLTQYDLADLLGYTQKNVAKWEQGLSIPSIEVLIVLSRQMNLSLDEMLGLNNTRIIDRCAEFVFEKTQIPREQIYTFNDEYETVTETYYDIVYSSIRSIGLSFISSLEHSIDYVFKEDLLPKLKSKEYNLSFQFLLDNNYIVEEKNKLTASSELILEFLETHEKWLNAVIPEEDNAYAKASLIEELILIKQLKQKYLNKEYRYGKI